MMKRIEFGILVIVLVSAAFPVHAGIVYGYDENGRLTSATWDDGTAIMYVYDNMGNFVSQTVTLCTGTPTPTSTPTCLHHGDVNGSGSLTSADAQIVFYFVLGMISLTWEEECAADCNGSGSVTTADAQTIFMAVLGMGGGCSDPLVDIESGKDQQSSFIGMNRSPHRR
ncbi:hypothetical protein JXA80_03165 [bacterium]|nr:hypothetical protein [candidate division CSSED10-310 bacterium]